MAQMAPEKRDWHAQGMVMVRGTIRALCVLLVTAPALLTAAEPDPLDFSLGELVTQEVITVARKRQDIGNVAAAVHVVSSEDIARMGVTTLPDALRLVPGVHVAATGNNRWAVSVRG
ncbi:MAG: TonB-dependent receptor plug domain-containing protein, partial [Acidobacteria bacterium]|nr:TonB-dependent receptor plug domain-containing protein [Acidobacteriota bacterium]